MRQTVLAKKGKRELVVKASLAGKLLEKKLQQEIQTWVETVSKATNKASLLFNRMLLHCLEKNKPLPDIQDQTLYLHCFNMGVGRMNKKSNLEEHVWKRYFENFPTVPKQPGDTQAYVYAAKNYQTVFKNSLVFNFDGRQKSYLRKWIAEQELPKESIHPIRCAINGWGCKTPVPEKAQAFVEQQKQMLRTPQDGITIQWLGMNMETIVHYFWHILTYLEQFEDTKRFSIAPISRIKSHFLTIDTTVLYQMMKNVGLIECTLKEFREMRQEHFDSVFRLKGLCSGEFTYLVETDGVSICAHFMVPRVAPQVSKRAIKKAERVIAIDPGRTNIVYAVEKEKETGSVQTYRLTRGQYYNHAGMNACKKKTAVWQKHISEEEKIFMRSSPRTSNPEQWDHFLSDYISVYDKLWNGKIGKKWGRERFRVYCLKKKTLDGFFQSFVSTNPTKPVIAFGAAKFNPNSKSELSAPTTYVSKTCAKFYSTIMVDEYNTSKVCAHCDGRLSPVVTKTEDGQVRDVRGLRRCCSTVCSQVSFKNRDQMGALNILRCFESGTCRPHSLARNSGLEVKIPRAFLLRAGNAC